MAAFFSEMIGVGFITKDNRAVIISFPCGKNHGIGCGRIAANREATQQPVDKIEPSKLTYGHAATRSSDEVPE
jgi:hypothetical protein